jgi:hypothetical protein
MKMSSTFFLCLVGVQGTVPSLESVVVSMIAVMFSLKGRKNPNICGPLSSVEYKRPINNKCHFGHDTTTLHVHGHSIRG